MLYYWHIWSISLLVRKLFDMTRIAEKDLVLPALYLMSISPMGFISTSDLKNKLVELLQPSGADAVLSKSRPSETVFMQIVGNLKSHNTFGKNGYANDEEGGFKITESGREHLLQNKEVLNYLLTNGFSYSDIQECLRKIESNQNKKMEVFDENIIIREGRKKLIEANFYERSSKLRSYAIRYFSIDNKVSCQCCNFNFQDFYGEEIGKDFIEIHHTKPIFRYEEDDLDKTIEQAMENLIPVCSNCHRMIHKNPHALEIQILTASINSNGVFTRRS